MKYTAYVLITLVLTAPSAVSGPLLNDLLNPPVVDQRSPDDGGTAEGMGLAVRGEAQFIQLSKNQPLGQSFTLGSNAIQLWRVSVGLCHWPDSWQEGEEVTFTLWDSPEKRKKLYSRTLDFAHKWFKWDVPYDIHLDAQPGAEFYFELTHNGGGDDCINVAYLNTDAYPRGQAYVAGRPRSDIDLYFVAVARQKADHRANLRRFLEQFDYSLPGLQNAGAAFARGNMQLACRLILRHMSTRTEPDSLLPQKPETFDTTRADQICDENRLYKDPKLKDVWIEMSPQTTWREVWPDTAEYVRPNDVFAELGMAYLYTGNEKYARKMNELMADFMQDYPSPFDGGMRGARWVAMHIAWRLGDAWDGYGAAIGARGLSDEVRLAWIDYWGRMADFAEREPSGGNHANAVGEAMMKFAYRFPEYKASSRWLDFGFDKLISNSLDLFYPDGACKEPTMNYHGFSLANLMSGLEQARKYGLKVRPEINGVVERALAYTAYMLMPNGQIPSVGDTDCAEFRPGIEVWDGWRKGEAMDCYKMFGRKDCLYIASAGKEGERPGSASYRFPDIGHYIMRSDWGGDGGRDFEQARYLFLRAGTFGSHGHDDLNQITLYAYGRPLILDPGRTRYDSPLMPELSKNRSHNVLLVDDLPMQHPAPIVHEWSTTSLMDFVESTYSSLYPGVNHTRAVVFVRPDYFVMFDTVDSENPHRFGINFWLTPPEITVNQPSGFVHTNEPNGSNVLIQCMAGADLEITERKGSLDLRKRIRDDIPVVTFWKKGESEADFTTLLYPYPKGESVPSIELKNIGTANLKAASIRHRSGTDLVFYSTTGKRTSEGQGLSPHSGFDFAGKAGLLRLSSGGEVTGFALVGGTKLVKGNQLLVESRSAVAELCVRYFPDWVQIDCPSPEPSLTIGALGRRKAMVNGNEMTVQGDTLMPFSP